MHEELHIVHICKIGFVSLYIVSKNNINLIRKINVNAISIV